MVKISFGESLTVGPLLSAFLVVSAFLSVFRFSIERLFDGDPPLSRMAGYYLGVSVKRIHIHENDENVRAIVNIVKSCSRALSKLQIAFQA
jgi:hypothetical protein